MSNEHPSIINHHQILLKASTLYFDDQKNDAATFIQAVISELGHFLNASIYIYLERDGSSYEMYTSSKDDVSQEFLDQLKKSWTLMRDHVNLETKNQNVFEIKLFDIMKGLMQIVGVEDKQLDPNDITLVQKIIMMI
ncbi:MAG: hypothetical protein RBT45_07405, partial [Acholeplasmataceae bacterium]|nr:hypothetical protein [Acholeplasmataceae bacterium]